MKVDLDGIKDFFVEQYESRWFPMYALCGGIFLTGFTGDILWSLIGTGAFLILLVKGKVT